MVQIKNLKRNQTLVVDFGRKGGVLEVLPRTTELLPKDAKVDHPTLQSFVKAGWAEIIGEPAVEKKKASSGSNTGSSPKNGGDK